MGKKGFVVWLTGLPGSGKTTIAQALEKELLKMGWEVEVLDGDKIRKTLSPEAGFTREDRTRHILRVAYVSEMLMRHGVAVIVALVSPYADVRAKAREIIGEKFLEVYVKCSLKTCIKRDPKGLYKKALSGEITNMTGIQDPYEEPLNPDVVINTEIETPEKCIEKIITKLKKLGYINH